MGNNKNIKNIGKKFEKGESARKAQTASVRSRKAKKTASELVTLMLNAPEQSEKNCEILERLGITGNGGSLTNLATALAKQLIQAKQGDLKALIFLLRQGKQLVETNNETESQELEDIKITLK